MAEAMTDQITFFLRCPNCRALSGIKPTYRPAARTEVFLCDLCKCEFSVKRPKVSIVKDGEKGADSTTTFSNADLPRHVDIE